MKRNMSAGSDVSALTMPYGESRRFSTSRSWDLVVGGDEVPDSLIVSIGLDDAEVRGYIQPPCDGPSLEFGLQFRPLLGDAHCVFSLVMQQHGRRLNQPLNQKNLPIVGAPSLERIPQILPRFMGVPKLACVKSV